MRRPALLSAAVAALVLGGVSAAQAAHDTSRREPLASAFMKVDRSTAWNEVSRLKLDFPTFHTEGIAMTDDRIFLSSVEIIEPTKKYPTPQGKYDRTPGKGIGHLFVMDRQGKLIKDIRLGEGDMYHPGGIDFDGRDVWVPVAEYRPNSASLMYSVDAKTLAVTKRFAMNDHFGGVAVDRKRNVIEANTWGSRRFAEFSMKGVERSTTRNESHFIDYQDCQYVADRKQLCGGVTNLPQTPSAGGAAATYELGGLALLDERGSVLHDVPFQKWSSAGHVMTRNPMKMSVQGRTLRLMVAPDNGEEGVGTEIVTYEATVG